MRVRDLAVLILKEVAATPMQHAQPACANAGGVLRGVDSMAPGFHAVQLDLGLTQKGVEEADGVGAAADAGDHHVGQPARLLQDLRSGLFADHLLELPDHPRVRVRSGAGTQQVVGVVGARDPIADGRIHRILERCAAVGNRPHFGAQHLHAGDIGGLARDVDRAHVDHALQAVQRADRGGGDPVLAGAGSGPGSC
ncbi:hypothetical protein G6F65_019027 [Rhizopus arrhizus]|nr:hypothetical protein G6F65_019027 [Rhizopus arrhizus]